MVKVSTQSLETYVTGDGSGDNCASVSMVQRAATRISWAQKSHRLKDVKESSYFHTTRSAREAYTTQHFLFSASRDISNTHQPRPEIKSQFHNSPEPSSPNSAFAAEPFRLFRNHPSSLILNTKLTIVAARRPRHRNVGPYLS
jgi:hypothetical protein